MFDPINDTLPLSVPAASSPDLIGSTLSDIRAQSRFKVGVLPNASPSEDIYYELWPQAVSTARDVILTQLPQRRVLGQAEVSIPVTGAGAYDVTRYGFLRVDRVALVAGTTTTWIPLHDANGAISTRGGYDYAETGTPVAVTFDGRLLCVTPWESDTTASLLVQGTRLPDLMHSDSDASGLPRLLNNLTAIGAAIEVIGFDAEREDHYTRRLPLLMGEYERVLRDVRSTLLNNRRGRGGWRTAPEVNGAVEQGVRQSAVASLVVASVSASAAPFAQLSPVTVDVTPVVGESSVTFTLTQPIASGWTEPGWALRCVSEHQGEMFNVVVTPNRREATATLPINPDAVPPAPFTFMAGDTARLGYLTTGA